MIENSPRDGFFEMLEQLKIMHVVQRALDGLDIKASAGKGEWTRAINTTLCKIGRQRGCTVGARHVSRDDRDWGEWLYDVTWLKSNADDLLIEAPLVVECEWGNLANIDEDFQKLLLARSTVRLMIFDGGYSPGSEKIAVHLADQVRAFRLTRFKDAWLLAAWERTDSNWWFRWFTVENGATKPFPTSSVSLE